MKLWTTIKKWRKDQGLRARALSWLGYFLAAMLVCTLVSRGIYASALPRVSVDYASEKAIIHRVEAEGKVTAKSEVGIYTEDGVRIRQMLVWEGERVTADTPVAELDLEDLKDKIWEAEIEAEESKLRIADLEKNRGLQNSRRAKDIERAKEDYDSAERNTREDVDQAEKEMEDAWNQRDSLGDQEDYVQNALEQDEEIRAKKAEIEAKKEEIAALWEEADEGGTGEASEKLKQAEEELTVLQQELDGLQNQVCIRAEADWEAKRELYDGAVASAQSQANAAGRTRESALREALRNMEDASETENADSSLEIARLELQLLEDRLNSWKELAAGDGKVYAQLEGVVTRIQASPGTRTADAPIVLVSDEEQGFLFQAEISEEQKKYVDVGEKVQVKLGTVQLAETVASVEETEGRYLVSVFFAEGGDIGQSGTMICERQSELYPCCVPLQALYSDNAGDYVLVLDEKNTILGTELEARKIRVRILEKNEATAALETGALSREDQIMVSSDKYVAEGDAVRLREQ